MDAQADPGDHRGELTVEGYASFHDADTSAEVDAAFRSQRRIAVAYCTFFLLGVLGVAAGTVTSSWATTDRVLGGFSPSFLMMAIGLYIFFVIIGLAAATLANAVDDRMMGASSLPTARKIFRSRLGDRQAVPNNGSVEQAVLGATERPTG